MSTKREVPNVSYTNKDFNSIYVELLEYAKKFSYRWDPTISDESDPGVILLKLAALIGDKNNYNIDKNVLELMPNSVTQLSCARQLFSQCGYTMAYYNSAVGDVNLTVRAAIEPEDETEDPSKYTYTIPRFTMFTDNNNSVVYTSIEQKTLYYDTETAVEVIEGTVEDYTINGDSLITTSNLDSNNRLYFTESNIAENGIFITNVDSTKVGFTNYDEWYKVDTLETEAPLSNCYRFGLSLDGSLCYIQFPEDVELLFGEGVNIKYIKTSGLNGNIAAGVIKQFYVDTSVTKKLIDGLGESEVSATKESIYINNPLPIINGSDPETIDEAYRSYRRVKTTFDTLISLKDYTDNLVTSKKASNGFVCDRTNDIQRSYKILQKQTTGKQLKVITEEKEETRKDKNDKDYTIDVPSMTAFDLCVYPLEYIPNPETLDLFEQSFRLSQKQSYETFLKNGSQKSLQHDFLGFEENKILMVKNKYPVLCTIIPRYELTRTEKFEIQLNVEVALCKALNSNELDFGESVAFDTLRNTILNSDDRIKHIEGLTTPTYTTWVVYKRDGNIQEMRVDNDSFSGGFEPVTIVDKREFKDKLREGSLYFFDNSKHDMSRADDTTTYDKDVTYYTYDSSLNELWLNFRSEIYAKNILAGVSPLYLTDTSFLYGINQGDTSSHEFITKVTTETRLNFEFPEGSTAEIVSPMLQENENILLTAPNFVEENNFSSYVKMIYCLSDDLNDTSMIPPNGKYELKDNDFIVFFWKASDSDTSYTYVKYDASAESLASIISPTMELIKVQPSKLTNKENVLNYFRGLKTGRGTLTGSPSPSLDNLTPNQFVKQLTDSSSNEVLMGSSVVKTLNQVKIHINNTDNGCSNIYWILNETIHKNDKDYYVLFETPSSETEEQKYTLKSGEYFMYTDSAKSVLQLLGEGTVIERKGWITAWEAPVVTYVELISEGITILDDYWQQIRLSNAATLHATEMQTHLIGPGNRLYLSLKADDTDSSKYIEYRRPEPGEDEVGQYFYLDNKPWKLNSFDRISYTDESGNTTSIEQIDSSKFSWEATSILNLNVSPEEPQKFYSHQSITLYTDTEGEFTTITGDRVEDVENPVSVLCSNIFNKVGGSNLNVTYDEEPSEFIVYSAPVLDDDGHHHVIYNHSDLSATIKFNLMEHQNVEEQVNAITIPTFRLLKGSYLIQLDPSIDLDVLKLVSKVESTVNYELKPLFTAKTSNIVTIYNIIVHNNDETDDTKGCEIKLELQTRPTENSDVWEVYIGPLFRYSSNHLLKIKMYDDNRKFEKFEQHLLDTLAKLDPNSIYDYGNKDWFIENPLLSSSFLLSEHVYKPYTICEWKLDDSITEDIMVYEEVR